jgi:hypothetical protein
MTILPYVSSIINVANSFSQATRPKYVGQMSDLIQEYRNSTDSPSIEGWKEFYYNKIGENKVEEASDKIWNYITRIKENLNSLTREDVVDWTNDLIFTKTFSGLQVQLDVLEMVSEDNYRLATPEEEAQNIDGFVDGEPVSIKPISWKKKPEYEIPYRIIYYKNTKNGLVVSE